MGISKKARAQMGESSWIRRMFEEAAALATEHGPENVFDLSLGNPILEPPPEFRTELMGLAEDETPGTHGYMPNGGLPETRAAVAESLAKETGLPFTGGDVIMTCGAGAALNVTFKALLDPGDEVIHPPGTCLGDSIGFRWIDLTWQAPAGFAPYALLHSFGGQSTTIRFRTGNPNYWLIARFDEWCRGWSNLAGDPRYDTMPQTFTSKSVLVALRYALEEAG